MQLDVESLRTFATVLDLGSMTKAGQALSMSQSAVSWKIKRLEYAACGEVTGAAIQIVVPSHRPLRKPEIAPPLLGISHMLP